MRQKRVAIIGAGIVGLAHASAAARRGDHVQIFERSSKAQGASIRNFGMVWPIGQSPEHYPLACRSRELWLEASQACRLWCNACGSLHLAYREDEHAVLEEFASLASGWDIHCELISPEAAKHKSPAVREGLLAALWSPMELCVDPREALATLPHWLAELGVELHFGTTITEVNHPKVIASDGRQWEADHVIVCSGADFETLYPEVYAKVGLKRCKLQMLRTLPQSGGWRIGPHLAGGLTLRHYQSFGGCQSLGALKQHIAEETPELDRFGIHVMASQNRLGEVVLGDSHEYDEQIEPFDKTEIDELMLRELSKIIEIPAWTIAARWNGVYAKHPSQVQIVEEPEPGVTIVNATGGAGMTMSFALAERNLEQW